MQHTFQSKYRYDFGEHTKKNGKGNQRLHQEYENKSEKDLYSKKCHQPTDIANQEIE
jgi:hypothetical protein